MYGKLVIGLSFLFTATAAQAHNLQCDGTVVPQWVKDSCCGKADYHIVPFGNVADFGDHYEVTVFDPLMNKNRVLKVDRSTAMPSMDGCTSIFFPNGVDNPAIYCFFFNPSI